MSTNSVTGLTADRFIVRSVDGTPIAVWLDGTGPALVMVHGSIADHTTFEPFVAVLRHHFTTFAMDRRGFGASGDTADYSIERDFDDVAAVVGARTGGSVALWGQSLRRQLRRGRRHRDRQRPPPHPLRTEPRPPLPPGSIERIDTALARGDHDAAIVAVLVDILEMTDDEIDAFRASPLWPTRLAAAPTIPRESRAEQDWVYQPGQFNRITAPTLMLTGADSVPTVTQATTRAAAAIPNARIHTLEGHGHFAHKTDSAMVTALIQRFIAA